MKSWPKSFFDGKKRKKVSFYMLFTGIFIFMTGCTDVSVSQILDVKEIENTAVPKQEEEAAVEAVFDEDKIILSEPSDKSVLNEIQITDDQYQVFVTMIDEKNGYMLYCGTPGMGQMKKIFYTTDDRWKTYSESDISSAIDGYPTSLSAVSGEQIYIGTQMRSNGYLFASKDGGESWESVMVDEDMYFRTGYAPVYDQENGILYAFFDTGDNGCFLYQAENDRTENDRTDTETMENVVWENIGNFSLLSLQEDLAEEYFIYEGSVCIKDSQGKCYQINGKE